MNSEDRKEVEQNFSEKEQAKSATDEGCDKLREKLTKLEEENAELKDKNLRLAAEFENFRKRQEKIFAELLAQERDNIISKLLSIADDVSRALKAAQEGAKPDTIVEGVKIIANKINELLKLEGIEVIEPDGMPFDPLEHDAVAVEPVDSPELHHKVLRTVQRGYRRGERLIIAPKVVVGTYKSENESDKQSKDNDKNAEKS